MAATSDEASAPRCMQCEYNLTGIESARCPECGWTIDWGLARSDEETHRIGTPAYRARGWRRIPATLRTVALMLLRPRRYADQLRRDDPLWPALLVAGTAFAIAFVPSAIHDVARGDVMRTARNVLAYGAAIAVCIACNSIGFVLLCGWARRAPRWPQRARLVLVTSLYSTFFVAAWNLVSPPYLESFTEASFFWPTNSRALERFPDLMGDAGFLGNTVAFYWWVIVLFLFAIQRARPRWTAVFFIPILILSARVATEVCARILFL